MRRHAELSAARDHTEPTLGRNVMWQQQSVIHAVQNTLHEMNVRGRWLSSHRVVFCV